MKHANLLFVFFVFFVVLSTSSVCAETDECRQARAWLGAALQWEAMPEQPAAPGVEVRRQDYGTFRLRSSAIDTPLRIGEKNYEHGLGTHSISEIVVRLAQPGKLFEAEVGVDNNHDTGGQRGTVIFIVELAGKEAFRSQVLRGGQPAVPVKVELGGAKQFVLRVLDAGDGPAHDHADWASAAVTAADGRRTWLDEMPLVTKGTGLSIEIPFSFVYDGKPSGQLLPTWKRTHAAEAPKDGRERHVVTYTDPATGLEVVCEATIFADHPAVEWVLRFRNGGKVDTPILENIRPLDARVRVPPKGPVVLHHAQGSTCAANDFLPIDQPIAPNTEINLAPNGGRSSDGRLPFFNLAWEGGGLVGAIGWSGQWAMRLHRDAGNTLTLQAGQQKTHLKLHAGESIRTPRMLLVQWQGSDRLRGHNLLRRLLVAHYVPRIDGQVVVPPVTQNTWFVFNTGNDVTEQNQLEMMEGMPRLGVEVFWLDAGWFEGGWPNGVGSWLPKAAAFPRGLKPLGDAAHERGMKFIVWFEPERVHPASRIAKEHPEFVLHAGGGDGLFNLGDPAARKWLTDHLSQCIKQSGIDIYRNDFNIEPLRFWQAADAPDRQGMAEIRYMQGLYAMWDDLRSRHPGLWIDTCASGGRRIDLEILSRSLPLWRSDTQCCGQAMPVQDQSQNAGLSLYVPLHAGGCWSFDPYALRSVASTGTNICPDTRGKEFPFEQAKQAVAEMNALRPFYQGDFYPLLEINVDDRQWCGWQYDRPDLGSGFAMLFRRPKSPYAAVDIALRGLDAAAEYEVTFAETYEVKTKKKVSGAELARLRVEIPSTPGSVLVTYKIVGRR